MRVWWFSKIDPPTGLDADFQPVYFPSTLVEYSLQYPSNAPQIVLASNQGSGELPANQSSGTIYVQNDINAHGYNPNEEHSQMIGGRAYALRDDLNVEDVSSNPFTLIDYIGVDGRPSMAIFEVLRENDTFTFEYDATAGTILQAPMPLSLMPLPLEEGSNGMVTSRNQEVSAAVEEQDLPLNQASSVAYYHYQGFTFEDRKGQKWIYRGPHGPGNIGGVTDPRIKMQFYYKTQLGFAFPDETTGADQAPELGTIVPYLRPKDGAGGFEGDSESGPPIEVSYIPVWPEQVPELRVGETLTLPKFGLPQIRGQRSVQLLYQESHTAITENDDEVGPNSILLHDPTRQKVYPLSDKTLPKIPVSVATTQSRGKTFFQNLPTHLQERFFFDPLIGEGGALVFQGEFVDEIVGEDYLQLNVLSSSERATVKNLVEPGKGLKAEWDEAVEALSTKLEQFIENIRVPGTFIVDPNEKNHRHFDSSELVGLTPLPEPGTYEALNIEDRIFDEAVDSYALTATGGGEGYVVLFTGNGLAFTPKEEPVSMHIFRVGGGLYRGELKPIVAANPLSENVTVQHTGDFAADQDAYEFEWRKAPPVDGLSPAVYEFTHEVVGLSDSGWSITDTVNGESIVRLDAATNPQSLQLNQPAGAESSRFEGSFNWGGLLNSVSELSSVYFQLYKEDTENIRVFVNGVLALDTRIDLPASSLPSQIETIFGGVQFPTGIYQLDSRYFNGNGDEQVSLEYVSVADVDAFSLLGFRVAATLQVDKSQQNYLFLAQENGKNRHLVAGAGIDTLGDNYYIMRYRPTADNPLYPEGGYTLQDPGWSDWTRPALVEGWIKRVLAGINPFNQRVSDFFDNAIDTDVSLLTQAGTRWEGDIALTLDNVQDAGLIEIYETVLKRGISLSIDGSPETDFGPANDALLLAAGYLADLYMALGNEAYADASNPMILFDAQSIGTVADDSVAGGFEDLYRSTATSRFAFQGQVSSLLEEELHLLRGRDDFLSPSIEVSPAYNRLFWNYTRGIDAGEVIYALNYNITEKDGDDADGKIDAVDAQRQYPQGHGDAYGHYLTALTNYYRLLVDEQFTWGTRSEAVNILGQPVSVDYLDERKFATAAAALARTTRQIQTLEHRKAYLDADKDGWSHLNQVRENSRTGRIRRWGFDDWSARGGQMAYYNWITANAILPDEDNVNEGIQKIDRTTVPELDELAATGAAIQRRMDSVDYGLNPLDLTPDSLVFDISPLAQENGETHFDQIYERSVRALNNAFDVFDRATDSSRLLRSLENQNQNLSAAVLDQENAFVTELLEIYGSPYPGDIGPGKTYPQGYEGPDLYRSFYIDRPFEIFQKNTLFAFEGGKKEFVLTIKDDELIESLTQLPTEDNMKPYIGLDGEAEESSNVTYSIDEDLGPYQFADSSFGKRPQVGSIQEALAAVRLAEEKLYAGLFSMDKARIDFIDDLGDFEKDMDNRLEIRRLNKNFDIAKKVYEEAKVYVKLIAKTLDSSKKTIEELTDATKEALPEVVGFSNDVTSAARGALLAAKVGANGAISAQELAGAWTEAILDTAFDVDEFNLKVQVLGFEDDDFWRAQGNDLKSKYETARSAMRDVDALHTAYIRELERYRNQVAKGESVLSDREAYRKRASAVVQGYRTRDVAFRAFRTEALEQYQNLFDWAAKYAYLAAQAYDYETGLLGSDDGREFLGGIAGSRALGLLNEEGQPTFAASENGDPGLSGFLARMGTDWEVVKGRLGFNNPDVYGTTFSLRHEYFRIPEGGSGDAQWRERLAQLIQPNLLANATVATHALQIDSSGGTPVPGIIVEFPTEIASGLNFFGKPLAAGDHRFTESNFATKIHSAGVVFEDYEGMDPCLLCANNVPGHTIDDHGPNALSATPHVYLIPGGLDTMRTPPLGDSETLRQWKVLDHALPLPYDIGSIELSGGDAGFLTEGSRSLGGDFLAARRHQAFRAVDNAAFFVSNRSDEYTNSRLVGRSAVNSNWILVIPAIELLNDPEEGLRRFTETVSDIKVHLRTYSYSGN